MLFHRSATTILNLSRNVARRTKSSMASGETASEASAGAGGLVVAVGTTFGTYMMADFLSNFIQHPTQKVRSFDFAIHVFFASTKKVCWSEKNRTTLVDDIFR